MAQRFGGVEELVGVVRKLRTIVEVFRDLGGFIEKLGTGIRRMTAAMEQHGLPRPQFEELSGEFVVTLIGPGDRFMAEELLPGWMRGLNERQVQLLQFVQRQGRITRREYEELADVGSTVAKQDLRALIERGLLARRSAGPGTYYVATENGRPLGNLATDKRPITTDSA